MDKTIIIEHVGYQPHPYNNDQRNVLPQNRTKLFILTHPVANFYHSDTKIKPTYVRILNRKC